ncbi:MAG: hypothetical protein ABFD82_05860 [Syntrophaceae bacterium]
MPEIKDKSITDGQLSSLLLYISFCLVVFYPFKGLISFIWSSIIGVNLSVIVIPFLFIFMISFLFMNVSVNHIFFQTKSDIVLFACGLLGAAFALIGKDSSLFYNTFLLFFLPVLLSAMVKIDDGFFFKTVFLFFTISTVYMFVENVIIHPSRYFLSIGAPNLVQISNYTDHLVSSPDFNAILNLSDNRHVGASYRTAGYLGNTLAMPVIISMTATFFYVLSREKARLIYLGLSLLSFIVLISCLSTTATIACLLTIVFYECYIKVSFRSILRFLVLAFIVFLLFYSGSLSFLYSRLIKNLADAQYFATFFNHRILFHYENFPYLIWGKWDWIPLKSGSSHVDMINIAVAYGGIIAFLLFRRMLHPVHLQRRTADIRRRVYAFVVLTAFICLFHSSMTLNLNIMMLVTLLMLKSSQIFELAGNDCDSWASPVVKEL